MSSAGWTGAVLAGGKSSRMGRDKALIEIDGRTLLQRALDVLAPHADELLILGVPKKHTDPRARTIGDAVGDLGPLGGLTTALRNARNERIILLACDMPAINPALIEYLKAGLRPLDDAFVPQCDGRLEPLTAAYHRRCLPVFEACISSGRLKMSIALEGVSARYGQVCAGEEGWPADLFRNINAPGDL